MVSVCGASVFDSVRIAILKTPLADESSKHGAEKQFGGLFDYAHTPQETTATLRHREHNCSRARERTTAVRGQQIVED